MTGVVAALIIALFVIVVVWGWYLIPTKSGAHRSSTLSFWGRQSKVASQRPQARPAPEVKVVPVAQAAAEPLGSVPFAIVQQGSMAFARRRRVRTVLVAMAVITVAAGLYTGSLNWWLAHVAVDALLIIYYGLAMQFQGSRVGMASSVISAQGGSREVLRRVAGG